MCRDFLFSVGRDELVSVAGLGGKLLTLIAKVTIITCIGGHGYLTSCSEGPVQQSETEKPVLAFLQLYVQT